jgi:hypothetical protein
MDKQQTVCVAMTRRNQQGQYEILYLEFLEHEPGQMGPYQTESIAKGAITRMKKRYGAVMELSPEAFADEARFRRENPRWWEPAPPIDVTRDPIKTIKQVGSVIDYYLVACLLLPQDIRPRELVGYGDPEFLQLFETARWITDEEFDAEVKRREENHAQAPGRREARCLAPTPAFEG